MTSQPTQRSRDDDGFTLLEIVVTVTLFGLVAVAILTAVVASVTSSAVSRSAAQVETVVVNAADRVNRAPKRCDYTVYVQAAVQTQGWSTDRATVVQEFYLPDPDADTAGTWQSGPSGTPGCATPTPTDLLVQRVTITITSPDGNVHRSIQVVKSDV